MSCKDAGVINDVLRRIMRKKGITTTEVARQIKVTSRVITDRLRSRSPTIRTVSEIADTLGYKLVLVPKGREIRDDEYIVITAK